LAAQSGRGSAW